MSYKLLSVNSNPKIQKSNTLSDEYWSCILHMHPTNTRICPYQIKAGCKDACLNTAGLGGVFPSIQTARQRKTDLFLNNREEFMSLLVLDIIKFIGACERKGKKPAIRLNGTSDIPYENIIVEGGQTIFEMFPQVQFYDYTKIPTRKTNYIFNCSISILSFSKISNIFLYTDFPKPFISVSPKNIFLSFIENSSLRFLMSGVCMLMSISLAFLTNSLIYLHLQQLLAQTY